MSVKSVMRGMIATAAVVAALAIVPTNSATAQGLFDGFWGGGEEWGGKRQTVAFGNQYTPGQIIVSFGDRRLYHITKPGTAVSYPIAVPREKSRWSGVTSVSQKRENPDWTPTPEMFRENPRLPPWVPGGHPMNPLGNRALYLGASTYRIHGTDAPWTIGQAVSKGCIRMFNEDVQQLYPQIKVGTKVTVTWQKFNAKGGIAGTDQPPAAESVASNNNASNSDSSNNDGQPKYKNAKANTDEAVDATLVEDLPYGGDGKPKSRKTKVSDASDASSDNETTSKPKSSREPKYVSSGPQKRYFIPYRKPLPATEKSAELSN
jgi:lipoprotein-anchoring transpeptidase ErfK/SrfK